MREDGILFLTQIRHVIANVTCSVLPRENSNLYTLLCLIVYALCVRFVL
jgi:hypothetical protein